MAARRGAPVGPDEGTAHLVREADGLARVVLDAPGGNLITPAVVVALEARRDELAAEPPTALVVQGAGRAFSAGASPWLFLDPAGSGARPDPGTLRARVARLHALSGWLPRAPFPSVAALEGPAFGGGLELALGCDQRVAGATAAVALPEVHLGLLPAGGGTQRLARLVGPSRAKDLVAGGRRLGAAAARATGLVDLVVARGEAADAAADRARALAAGDPARWQAARRLAGEPATAADQNWK